jgi:hypothetical protein
MIAGVRPRTILVLPRRAWRAIKARSTKPEVREERVRRPSLIESVDQMFSHHVRLAFRDLDE